MILMIVGHNICLYSEVFVWVCTVHIFDFAFDMKAGMARMNTVEHIEEMMIVDMPVGNCRQQKASSMVLLCQNHPWPFTSMKSSCEKNK